ncbi:hypothetical protein NSS69_11905 [Macrococcus sp. FSL W8-0367]
MKTIEKELAEVELKKFFSLLDSEQEYYMPRCVVDKVWHEKLKDEEEYKKFCMNYSKSYVKHEENKGKGDIPWVSKYENKFGKLAPVWFTNEEGDLLNDTYERYIKEGEIHLEWDCVPIMTTD